MYRDDRRMACGLELRPVALAAALMLATGPIAAQEAALSPDEIRRDLATPQSTLHLSLLGVRSDNRLFGQYRGLTQAGAYGVLSLDVVQRDDATGTWFRFEGRDLGLATGEFRMSTERQGQWSVSVAGSAFVRREPLQVVSGLSSTSTASPVVSSTAPKRELTLEQGREVVEVALRRILDERWDLRLTLRQDRQEGARMLGRGTPSVMEFLAEPIDRVTTRWGGQLGYADRQFQLLGGYTGTHHENRIPVIFSGGGNIASFGSIWAIATPPSNTAHQLHLSGGINLTPDARSSFKLSRTVAEQNEPFDPFFVRLAGAPSSLNGRVVTTLGFADLSLRPAPALDVQASVRYENRDDQTPVARYLAAQAPSLSIAGVTGFNKPRSQRQLTAALETGVRMGGGYRLGAGAAHETLDRNVPDTYRRMGYRARTEEDTLRLELRRGIGDSWQGSIAWLMQRRDGSEYIPDTYDPAALSNQLASLLWADRQRSKLRLSADWQPEERISMQFLGEASHDQYSGRTFGPREGRYRFASLDGAFQFHPQWSFGAWASRSVTEAVQVLRSDRSAPAAAGGDTIWSPDIRNRSQAAGASLKGSLTGQLQTGVDISRSREIVSHDLTRLGGTGTLALPTLPPMAYRQLQAKVFGELAWRRDTAIRVDVGFDRRSNNDWTWQNWIYNGAPSVAAAQRNSDGTVVTQLPADNVSFVAVTLRHRWR